MRASLVCLLLCGALIGAAVPGCGDDDDVAERKRALLKPRDAKRKFAEAREKRRLYDDQGELLPTGEKVAGVMIPKGLTLYRHHEQHWFFKSDRIPAEKLDRFFAEQLFSTTVERTPGSVKFGGAVPKGDLKAKRIDLHVTRLRGKENATEVYIREPAPFKIVPPELDQDLQTARRYAD